MMHYGIYIQSIKINKEKMWDIVHCWSMQVGQNKTLDSKNTFRTSVLTNCTPRVGMILKQDWVICLQGIIAKLERH